MITRRDLILGSGASLALTGLPFGALAQQPVKGGVLRMLLNVEPPSLVSAVNSSLWIACLSTKMLEGLVAYGHDMKLRPGLAESFGDITAVERFLPLPENAAGAFAGAPAWRRFRACEVPRGHWLGDAP